MMCQMTVPQLQAYRALFDRGRTDAGDLPRHRVGAPGQDRVEAVPPSDPTNKVTFG